MKVFEAITDRVLIAFWCLIIGYAIGIDAVTWHIYFIAGTTILYLLPIKWNYSK